MADATGSRRGRPPAGTREERRRAVLEAALAEVVERGPAAVTMLDIARRAGASKQTLYAWFGDRDGLFAALIRAQADRAADRIDEALDADEDVRSTLVTFATGLLRLLTSPPSIALNRAAMTDDGLALELLASGRHRVGPLVEDYLRRRAVDGALHVEDPGQAFTTLYGLVVRDIQIRVLLGEPPPDGPTTAELAKQAVDQFLQLHGVGSTSVAD